MSQSKSKAHRREVAEWCRVNKERAHQGIPALPLSDLSHIPRRIIKKAMLQEWGTEEDIKQWECWREDYPLPHYNVPVTEETHGNAGDVTVQEEVDHG